MDLQFIDHYTIRVKKSELPAIRKFYISALGLKEGFRPPFDFPGHWLYLGDRPTVHLMGNAPEKEPKPHAKAPTGKFNHVSFRAKNIAATRKRLKKLGMKFHEQAVPHFPLYQIFLTDPVGVQIELTFKVANKRNGGSAA